MKIKKRPGKFRLQCAELKKLFIIVFNDSLYAAVTKIAYTVEKNDMLPIFQISAAIQACRL